MQYRQLGQSGLRISTISLGSWLTYGMGTADTEARHCLDAALDGGINFLDTADVYNQGAAERVIGQYLKGRSRQHIVLATKAYFPMGEHWMDRGLSWRYVAQACDASLERLQTDWIDLYQCHRYDTDTPLEEVCFGMNQLIQQGKIRYWGVSQWTGVQIVNAIRICERNGWRKPISNQPIYNMLNRSLEVDVMQVCADEGLGLVVYSPLAQGILSGKYQSASDLPPDSRAGAEVTASWFNHKRLTEDNFHKLDELRPIAAELDITLAQLALAWTLRVSPVTSAITGASRVSQVTENLAAANVQLSAEVQTQIEAILQNAPIDQYSGARVGWGGVA
jgi:voltage-dependent potassium channel beta subunit